MTSDEKLSLDPADWDQFRAAAHRLLDACVDRLAASRDQPWRPVPEEIRAGYQISDDAGGLSHDALVDWIEQSVLPYGTGNTHPRFFGWVHGTGLAEGLLSELAAATINANCGGRDHGMIYLERAVVDWARRQMGFPETASGLLVAGTSQATLVALTAARLRAVGQDVRRKGHGAARLRAYAGAGTHNCVVKALEVMGLGSEALCRIPDDGNHGMAPDTLRRQIAEDRAAGWQPFVIVGTAGSVNFGHFDPLDQLATVARDEGLWFHVDGAFGAWLRLAGAPWHDLTDGIARADSLACDFHKWMYVPYDCGLCLIADEAEHRAAFAARPDYLAGMASGLASGEPWFCDYGIDLSRGNRALKVWSALRVHGRQALGAAITENCRAAARMAALVSAIPDMALARPVVSNICVFTADATLPASGQSALNKEIAQRLQLSGEVVFSTTTAPLDVGDVVCLRAAITNHRTRPEDVKASLAAIVAARQDISRF